MKKNPGHPTSPAGGVSPRGAALGMAAFSIAILLLNGPFLSEGASRLEYGTKKRIFWTKALRPLDTLSEVLPFHKVREAVRDTAGAWLNGGP